MSEQSKNPEPNGDECPKQDLSQYDEDFFLFLEAGFIAINQADEDSAVKLFKTCELFRPDNPMIKTGLGYLHLNKLELKAAKRLFEEVLAQDPQNALATTLLGLTLSFNPAETTQGEKMLHEVVTQSEDQAVKQVADTALNFVETHVKQAPGPATSSVTKQVR